MATKKKTPKRATKKPSKTRKPKTKALTAANKARKAKAKTKSKALLPGWPRAKKNAKAYAQKVITAAIDMNATATATSHATDSLNRSMANITGKSVTGFKANQAAKSKFKNALLGNWAEKDHPRDKAGKFKKK